MLKIKSKYSVTAVSWPGRWIYLFFIIAVFFISTLEAADTKNFENRIKELENENFRLCQQLAMEAEASKFLGQKLLKAYEEKVVIENEFKEAKAKIKNLEGESAGVRKLMENEVLGYRKKLGAVQEELGNLKKKFALLTNDNKVKIYIAELEKENMTLKKKLSAGEKDTARIEVALPPAKEKAEEPKITTSLSETGETLSEQGGKILRVSKEFNFVIVEFSNQAGVTAGRIFSVLRGEKKIGELEITKVKERYAFASIVNAIPGEEIKEGDSLK